MIQKKWIYISIFIVTASVAAFIFGRQYGKVTTLANAQSSVSDAQSSNTQVTVLNDNFEQIESKLAILKFSDGHIVTKLERPFLAEGCEGEQCGQVKDLTLARSALLMKDAAPDSAAIAEIPKGEVLKRAKIFIKVVQIHKLSDDQGIVLFYASEGRYVVAKSDLTIEQVEIDPAEVTDLKTESWIFVETQKGEQGWIAVGEEPLFEQ